MTFRVLAAALLLVAATPAFAQGIDSRHSPYPASAYSGYASAGAVRAIQPRANPPLYRFSGQHAGGPLGHLVGE